MATPSEKLAASLEILKALQDKGKIAIKRSELTRTHKDRLLKNGFISEVYSGWFIISSPENKEGDSTSWYSSYLKMHLLKHSTNSKRLTHLIFPLQT